MFPYVHIGGLIMRITNPRDLGRYVRERRRDRGETQAALAKAAGVSRRWLADLEAGKPTAEVGLVFRALAALDLMIDARPADSSPDHFDLDEHLRAVMRPDPLTLPPVAEPPGTTGGDQP